MAARTNIIIDQGSDFEVTINLKDLDDQTIDLTGYTARAQMRKSYSSLRAYDFTTLVDTDEGYVVLSMPASLTDSIPAGRYLYDCELTSSSNVRTRLVQGIATITPQVTR